jgi:hypothetical protein
MVKAITAMLLAFAIVLPVAQVEADTWRGTAPFCKGECKPGETEIRRSKSGDGARCWTGTKVLCANDEERCPARQTKTKCYGPLMICRDGYYEYSGGRTFKTCNRYVCGICFGGRF